MKVTWSEVEQNNEIKKEFKGYQHGLVRSYPGEWTMKPETAKLVPTYSTMKVRPTDIWVVTYPKCGTTWTQELVWQVVNKVDLEGGKRQLGERFPFLEFDTLGDIPWMFPGLWGRIVSFVFSCYLWWRGLQWWNPRSWWGLKTFADVISAMPEDKPRFIKTHLPLSLLPKDLVSTAKVIYVARNPRDVMVSYYHHHKLIKAHRYVGDMPNFAKRFTENQIMMGPFFPHIEEGWALRDHPNFLFLFYEDIKRDMKTVIRRVSKFLDSPLTEEQIDTLEDHLDIKNFRNNPAVNMESAKGLGFFEKEGNFIRKGEVGGWKKEFEEFPELEEHFDSWVEKNMETTNVKFPNIEE